MNARLAAVRVLMRVLDDGWSLTDGLNSERVSGPRERALMQELSYGTLRWYQRLSAVAGQLLDKPLARKDRDIECLVWLGLYQLIYTRIPVHAAVNETVGTAGLLGKAWAARLVNGVLRNFERNREAILATADRNAFAALSHPEWLVERLKIAYPEQWCQICMAANEHPPMSLRVNQRVIGTEEYVECLKRQGIDADCHPLVHTAVLLRTPVEVTRLPGFFDGAVSVQDAAGQLAASLLECHSGMRVLDACAAPGGKTGHILEFVEGPIELVAVEKHVARMRRLRETLERLGVAAQLCLADVTKPEKWWDGNPFDRILIDAPCSATGVIRRHPDIKWRRTPDELKKLTAYQFQLINKLWGLLKNAGMLVYATCSILPEENDELIKRFISQDNDTRVVGSAYKTVSSTTPGWQILPGEMDMDGFYYARLCKG